MSNSNKDKNKNKSNVTPIRSRMPTLVYFSEGRIAFQREVHEHHPAIAIKAALALAESNIDIDTPDGQGILVGVVAAEFNIVMEGWYSPDQIELLYTTLFHKLRDKRKEIILP